MSNKDRSPLNAFSISNIISNERQAHVSLIRSAINYSSSSAESSSHSHSQSPNQQSQSSTIAEGLKGSNGVSAANVKAEPAPRFNQSTMTTKFRMRKNPLTHIPSTATLSDSEQTSLGGTPVSAPELDSKGGSKNSCTRCRRLKKKCNKCIPECSNCNKSGELCIYIPRKARKKSSTQTPSQYQNNDVFYASDPVNNNTNNLAAQPLSADPPQSETDVYPFQQPNIDELSGIGPINLPSQNPRSIDQPSQPLLEDFIAPVQPTGGSSSRSSSILSDSSRPGRINTTSVLISSVGLKLSAFNSGNYNESSDPEKIDKSLAITFVEAFFKHNHRAYPFINENEFMTKFNSLVFTKLGSYSKYFRFEVFMIMAIGCTSLERANVLSRDQNYKLSESFVNRALTYMDHNLIGKNLDNIKSLLLLGLYSYFDPSEFSSWEITGKLVRQSISLGLNRKLTAQQSKKMTPVQIEMRYRTFWSVYIMDRMVSVSLGRPVGIHDNDINVPIPTRLEGEKDNIEITKLFIKLRQIEGQVLLKVHSVNSGAVSVEKKQNIFNSLRVEIENWYAIARSKQKDSSAASNNLFSFHGSFSWFAARYYHLLTLLYVPSYLEPRPSPNNLELLGKSCLQSLSSTYNLFTANLLPLNWITLYRFLTICTTILHCLCKWSIDLIDSKNEIYYCIEILDAFGNDWLVAKKCAQVFKTIDNKMLEISLGATKSKDIKMDKLLNELLGASSAYHEILNDNSVDIGFDNSFIKINDQNDAN